VEIVMIRLSICVLLVACATALAGPALAQDAAACQQSIMAYRQAAGAVMQKSADIPGALQARADLADEEAAARSACQRIPQLAPNIDVTREDIDLALGRAVPACRTAIETAAPHVKSAMEIARSRDPVMGSKLLSFLKKARTDAEEPCKGYQGVLGRILRAENMVIGIGATAPN
jgi:hypothetical protein